jgi:hypothetical protein
MKTSNAPRIRTSLTLGCLILLLAQIGTAQIIVNSSARKEKETPSSVPNPNAATNATLKNNPKVELGDPDYMLENNVVSLNAGVILLSPYKLGAPTNTGSGRPARILESDDSQARFYIDVAVNYLWVANYERRARWAKERMQTTRDDLWDIFQGAKKTDQDGDGGEWGLGSPDFQGHIMYVAKDDKEASAAAIVGSGEFALEVTVGLPFYQAIYTRDGSLDAKNGRELYDKTLHAHWLGIVGSWSGTTDGDAFDVHSRYFFGMSYRGAFKAGWSKQEDKIRREVTATFQIGYAAVDSVRFVGNNDTSVFLTHGSVPKYHMESAMGVEAEVMIPLGKTFTGTAGARIYTGIDPNPWNAYVAVTVPLEKVFNW